MLPAPDGVTTPLVLVVDDSRTVRMILGRGLRALGCEVIEAADGHEALVILHERGGVDLILTDVNMPGMDGCALIQAVRADPALAHVPALVVTASSAVGDLERARAAGATGHLPKPCTPEMLRERLTAIGVLPDPEPNA